ncbi:laccase domain-containing protein [Candidatus Saccharibacteria bacterium]|nr:laccase domain-containing protein [Candidatus Saccharibacteria bacterium]
MIRQVLFDGKVEVGISEIGDGNMRFFDNGNEADVIENQEKLGKILELDGNKIARIRTIYDDRESFTDYYEITDRNVSEYAVVNPERQIPVSDGLIVDSCDVGILLPLADCLGIVVFDEEHQVVGLLHSGRQNIEQYGPKKYIEYFVENFDSNPGELKVYFSPHALNYQLFKYNNKTLSEVAREQLAEAGVLLENIIDYRVDTVKNTNLPSNSSGDKTRRFAIVVRQIH